VKQPSAAGIPAVQTPAVIQPRLQHTRPTTVTHVAGRLPAGSPRQPGQSDVDALLRETDLLAYTGLGHSSSAQLQDPLIAGQGGQSSAGVVGLTFDMCTGHDATIAIIAGIPASPTLLLTRSRGTCTQSR